MDDVINQPQASYVTAVQNNYTIQTAKANYLYLKKGYNDLSPSGINNFSTVNGSFLSGGGPFPMQAFANRWSLSGTFSNNDYYIVDPNGNPLTIDDPYYLNYSTPCGQAIPPCPQPPCDNWLEALQYCPYCDVINTDDFINRSLNVASLVSMAMINSTDSLNYRRGIDLLSQILLEDYANPDDRERLILNFDYLKLMESVGYAFLKKQILESENSTLLCEEMQKVINVIDKYINQSILEDNYDRRFLYCMDKAQAFRIAGRRDLALTQLNSVHGWASDSDYAEIDKFICVIEIENEIINGSIDLGTIQEELSQCSGNEMKLSRPIPDVKPQDTQKPEIKFSITPNPIANVGSIKTNMEKCNVTIYDNLGRILIDKVINYDVDIDFSNWVSGIYSIRYSDLQSSQSMTEKFVIK
jgi:hypothetical protein